MTKVKKTEYANSRIEALHKTAQGLARVGALDKKTMRAFDTFCLTTNLMDCVGKNQCRPELFADLPLDNNSKLMAALLLSGFMVFL